MGGVGVLRKVPYSSKIIDSTKLYENTNKMTITKLIKTIRNRDDLMAVESMIYLTSKMISRERNSDCQLA